MDKLEEVAGVDDSCKVKVKGQWRWQCNLCEKNYSTKYSLQTHKVGHSGLKPFECADCGKAFKQLSHLNTHQLRHAGLRPHCCTVCGKRFVQSSHLKRHMNTHNPETALYCDVCSRKFTYPSELRAHKEKMHGPKSVRPKVPKSQKDVKSVAGVIDLNDTGKANGVDLENVSEKDDKRPSPKGRPKRKASSQITYTDDSIPPNSPQWLCNKCSETFQTQNALIAHMASSAHQDSDATSPTDTTDMAVDDNCAKMVGGVRRWHCKKCEKTYATKYGLITHMSDHIGTKPFQCKVCQKRFKQLSHLNTHRLRHDGLRPHSCNVCGKSFVQRSHLKRHLHTHTSVGAYFCDWCPRKFTYPSELRFHTEKMHSPGKDGKGKDASSKKHVDVVKTKVDPKPDGATVMICPECGKSFNYQSQLDKHMKRHTNNRPHICKECGMQFMEIHHLNQHSFTHTGLKPYKCPICSRGFALEANMRRHFLIHSGVRAFECHLCRRRFAQKQTLTAHMIVHSDKKPHVCKFCGKAFRRNHNLICHLRLHTDSKPFKCLSCGLRFNRKGNLKKHQKDKHGLDPTTDFIHLKALNLPNDQTLISSLNSTSNLYDVVGADAESPQSGATDKLRKSNLVEKENLQNLEDCTEEQNLTENTKVPKEETTGEQNSAEEQNYEQGSQSGVSNPSKGVCSDLSNVGIDGSQTGLQTNPEKEILPTSKDNVTESRENVASISSNLCSQGKVQVSEKETKYLLGGSEVADSVDGSEVANSVDGNEVANSVGGNEVANSVENSSQLGTDVLLQDESTMGDNFMFNREPVEGHSTIFEDELKWEADLGLVQQEEVLSSTELDSIVNEPRTIVSKYFVKNNMDSKVTSEMVDEETAFEPGDLAGETRVSKRKGMPRKLDHTITSAPGDN